MTGRERLQEIAAFVRLRWAQRVTWRDRLAALGALSWGECARGVLGYFVGSWLNIGIGMLVCWLTLNAMAPPGVVVIEQVEAEGPQFSDPNSLDIVTRARRNRPCPSETQRYVWRRLNGNNLPWHEGDGPWHEQAIPLVSTINPFLAESDTLILTLPSAHIPDREHGGWMFRSVTTEHCGFLPSQLSEWFGSRIFRSRDVPVNFVGAPHTEGAKP